METASETTLIQQAQHGNVSAFGKLYDQYAERVYRYLAFRWRDSAEAEDLTADVFIKAFQNIRSYRAGQAPFGAWLFRIAHNVLIDHWRAKTRRQTIAWETLETTANGAAAHAFAQVFTRAELAWGVAQLTDLQQHVIALRFVAECSIAETARAMQRSEEAVKDLQHKALLALRKKIGKP
ncbi:MAG: sigma-70 family RNA polymerase sigma factor [Chloroflexi bacterium]|nr:sigma-70 family RNA polymerase sigma factor [Chloroflexota bacterium]